MDASKLTSVFNSYSRELHSRGVKAKQFSEEQYDVFMAELPTEAILSHALWMCEEAINHIQDNRIEKAHRWLGHVQALLGDRGIFTLNQVKEHSRPRCPHCNGPEGDCNEVRNNPKYHLGVFCKGTGMYLRESES